MNAVVKLDTTPTPTLTAGQQVAYDHLFDFAMGETQSIMATLEGFAGSGKSFLVGRLVASLEKDILIAVAAPTNKAAKVLKENLVNAGCTRFGTKRVSAKALWEDDGEEWNGGGVLTDHGIALNTIHSFLGLQMVERDDGTQECKQKRDSGIHMYDLLIVDEASMVSPHLFKLILDNRRSCRVLFVGDPAQLPPVDALVAQSPVFDMVQDKVRLSEIVRQAQGSPIIQLSMRVRQAIEEDRRVTVGELESALPDGVNFVGVMRHAQHLIPQFVKAEMEAGRDCRVVSFRNDAVQHYNAEIHALIHGWPEPGSCRFAVGEAVIVHAACNARKVYGRYPWAKEGDEDDETYNAEDVRLHTSQELTVTRIDRDRRHRNHSDIPSDRIWLDDGAGGVHFVYVAQDDNLLNAKISELFNESRDVRLLAERNGDQQEKQKLISKGKSLSGLAWRVKGAFAPLRHAYAITCHKAQGSTFDTTLVDWNDLNRMRSDYQFNRAIYVAVTRSRTRLALFI